MVYSDELYHWGIKGMRWGVRRYQKKDGTLTAEGKKRYGDDADEPNVTKKNTSTNAESSSSGKKRLKDMSNDEIKERIDRLKMEKEYKALLKDTDATARGKDFAIRVLEKIGESALVNVGSQAATKALGVAINKIAKVDSSDAVNRIVNPNKGQSDKK